MADDKLRGVFTRLFNAALLLLGTAIALSMAFDFFARIWGWIALVALVGVAIWIVGLVLRSRRDRRW